MYYIQTLKIQFNHIAFIVILVFFKNCILYSQNIIENNTTKQIGFIENKGQWNNDVFFKMQTAATHVLFKKNTINYYYLKNEELAKNNHHLNTKSNQISGHYISVDFKNCNANAIPQKVGEANNYYFNYYLENDKSKWKSHVNTYTKMVYNNLYNNIDLFVGAKTNHSLKLDWLVKPNGKIEDIALKVNGADSIYLNYGELFITHSLGNLKEKKPYAYQYIEGKRIDVEVNYIIKNNCIGFKAASYNKNYNLIIDPDLIFSTYSGSTEDNFGYTATYDSEGNLFAGGITTNAFGGKYPVTAGAFQLVYKGGTTEPPVNLPCDITISKYSSDGKQLIYATYLGGSNNENPHSLIADKFDNLVVMGTTKSKDYPVSISGFDTSQNGDYDLIITKFNKDGSALLGSTYFGGYLDDGLNRSSNLNVFYADEFKGDIIIDKNNNIIVGSCSYSLNFPITAGSFGSAISDTLQKGVVFKFSENCENLIFSAALPGNSEDVIYSVDLNTNDDIFIAGSTTGAINIATATNSFFGGKSDGFFAKIKNDGSAVLKLKYFGTASADQIFSLELDEKENIYVVGNSLGNLQKVGNVYFNSLGKQFISKINNDFNAIEFTSIFGRGLANLDISINAFLLDECGRLYISGWGGTNGVGNTFNLPITADAFQKTTDGRDFYLMVLSENAEKLLFGSYFGGDKTGDHVDGGTSRFDKKGFIYQSVCASCPDFNGQPTMNDFPISTDAVFKTNVSPRCSNAAFKMSFSFKEAKILMTIDTCARKVTLNTPTDNALNYLWLLPNGKTSNIRNPIIEIDEINNKEITLILNAFTNCADTTKATLNYVDSFSLASFSNVFTPNNDGINDYFSIEGITKCGEFDLTFYNRWGQEVFKTDENGFKWDGKTKAGEPLLEGVYFYLGKYKNQNSTEVKLHGTVTIIR